MDNEIKLANREFGPKSTRIVDEELLKTLKKIILHHWQLTNDERDFFPAPQPVSLDRSNLMELTRTPYLICAKSDGMRFLLLCYKESSYMVDRSFKFYKVKLMFRNDKLYTPGNDLGGIFDGELILNNKNKWQYVIHDCININGKDISRSSLPDRRVEIEKMTNDYWIPEGSEFRITSKQFFPLKKLYLLNELIKEKKLDHKTDGIIFTPRNKKVGSHTQHDLFKWKPRELHTFDFKITKGFDGITAFINKNGTHTEYARAPPNSEDEKIFLEKLATNCPEFINGSIVECEYDEKKDMYIPIKLRLDKTHPNSFFTINKTLTNIKENITVEELIGLELSE